VLSSVGNTAAERAPRRRRRSSSTALLPVASKGFRRRSQGSCDARCQVITWEFQNDGVVRSAEPSTGAGRSSAQLWAIRIERVKDSRIRQCLFCGRNDRGRTRNWDSIRFRIRVMGGGMPWSNTLALCPLAISNSTYRGLGIPACRRSSRVGTPRLARSRKKRESGAFGVGS